ncbi:MAG: hypothetical protein AAF481_05685 [Acidobacteriota bacterium]
MPRAPRRLGRRPGVVPRDRPPLSFERRLRSSRGANRQTAVVRLLGGLDAWTRDRPLAARSVILLRPAQGLTPIPGGSRGVPSPPPRSSSSIAVCWNSRSFARRTEVQDSPQPRR